MSKRALCLCLAFMLTVFALFTQLSVFAEEESVTENLIEADERQEDSSQTVESTVETTEEIIPADFPALTVNVISNYFPSAIAEYNSATREVTVIYWINLARDVLSTQWFLIYDPEVFTFSEEKNPVAAICPATGGTAVLRADGDTIRFSASGIKPFDFSSQMTPYVQIVFDVKELNPEEPVTTKIDLTVDMLRVTKADKTTGVSDPEQEVTLVSNGNVLPESSLNYVRSDRTTTLTPSNFVQATTAPPSTAEPVTDASGNVIEVTTEPAEADSTGNTINSSTAQPSTALNPQPTEAPTQPTEPNDTGVKPGSAGTAWICLAALVIATSVLFVMRKKGILY